VIVLHRAVASYFCIGPQTRAFIAGISGVNVSGEQVVVSSSRRFGVVPSARRYKKDVQDMGDASNGLLRLRSVVFRYK